MATAEDGVQKNISHLNEVLQMLRKCHFTETNYYQLGLSLGLSARTLDTIEVEHKGRVSRCLLEVLKKWLSQADHVKSKGDPSYYTLIVALRAIEENAVADGIEKEKEPDIHELLNQLSSIADRWELIGLGLNVNRGDLESAKNEQSNILRLNRVLECWKKNMSPPYTWATILDVISGPVIKNRWLRDAIEQWLLGTEKGSPASAVIYEESILEQNKKLLRDYTVDQICDLLDKIGLGQYKEVFKEMEVNGRSFFRLTEDDLQDAEQFNMKNKFHRKIVMDIVNGAELVAYLDIETSSKKIDDKYLEAAMKDGSVKSRITKAVVQGEARAGKTSLKCLLLSQSYKKPSTSCVEASQVAYGSFSVNRFGRTGKRWTLVDDDEMNDKVLVELKSISETKKDAIYSNSSLDELVRSDRPDDNITVPHSITTKTDELVPLQPSSSGTAIAGDSSSEVDHMEAIAEVKELYERCKKIQKKEGISLHQEWLYFVDTGGQIQFQKLLPAFMPFASVLILVLNLAKSLSDKASTEMELEHDQQISVSEYSLTVEEILKQLLSAIALSTEHFNEDLILSRYMKPPEENLNVLAVATYRDEYDKKLAKEERVESLQAKEEKLKQIFDSMKQKCTIVRSDPLNILYEVDGSKAMRGEFDDPIVDQIAEKLNNQAYEVNVPIKWYCFSILLRKIAKEGCGVLSVSYCQTLGEQLGLQEGEVKSALYFLHILNMLLYYPDSPVDDMVFVILDSLVDIIRELVVLVCTARDKGRSVDDDVYKLATEGFLSIKVLKCSKQFCRISLFFNEFGQKLLDLFQHLLIAVPIQEKGIKFFMPALLPVKDVLNTSPFPDKTSTPLLFFFESAVPMGLFCAFIVHLLSGRQLPATSDYESSNSSPEDDGEIAPTSSSSRWRIIQTEESNWSNYFTIQHTSMKGIFVFVERLECIEVHSEYPKVQAAKSIRKAIKATLKIRGLKEKAKRAFYCNCSYGKGLRHVAVVHKDEHEYVLRCTLSKRDVRDLDEETSSWLNKTDGKGKNTSSSALPQSSDSTQVVPPQSYDAYSAPLDLSFDGMVTVGKKIGLYSSDSKHELLLEECGLRLSLPVGVVCAKEYKVAAQGLWGGEFVFPEGTRLISGVCFISVSPSQLTEPVTVQLMHCADIKHKSQCKYLSFVVAESHQSPFHFQLLAGGAFSTGSQYGSIQLNKFSLLAIVLGVVGGVAAGVAAGTAIGIAAANRLAAVGIGGVALGTQRASQESDDTSTGSADDTKGLPDCHCRAFLFYENNPPERVVLSLAVSLDHKHFVKPFEDITHRLGTEKSNFRFKFSQSASRGRRDGLLKLINFTENGMTINGWTVTALIPPIINESHVYDFCEGHSVQPPYVQVSVQAHQTIPGFKDKLQHTLKIEGIDVTEAAGHEDCTKIVIEKSLSEILSHVTVATAATASGDHVSSGAAATAVREEEAGGGGGGEKGEIDVKKVKKLIEEVLVSHHADLTTLPKESLSSLANQLYTAKLISNEVKEKPSIDVFIHDFKASIKFMRKLPQIQEHCRKFLKSFDAVQGSYAQAAIALQEDWNEAIESELGSNTGFNIQLD